MRIVKIGLEGSGRDVFEICEVEMHLTSMERA